MARDLCFSRNPNYLIDAAVLIIHRKTLDKKDHTLFLAVCRDNFS